MTIEANTISNAERGGLPNIVQKNAKSKRGRSISKLLAHQQHMRPHVAFGVEFRRLLDPLERFHLPQNVNQETRLIQQFKTPPRTPFRQNADELIAHSFRRSLADGWS